MDRPRPDVMETAQAEEVRDMARRVAGRPWPPRALLPDVGRG